ncbi:hypothetical protein BJ741DRAFT_617807 [Chytriomyces cf. hyalinus JEL632]|nr:hypothetical protein BJ741DRAFT_617807 [Chytriomyces cf. hyalinus JEL632]
MLFGGAFPLSQLTKTVTNPKMNKPSFGRFGGELYRASSDAEDAMARTLRFLMYNSDSREGADEEGDFYARVCLLVGRGTVPAHGPQQTQDSEHQDVIWIPVDRFGGAFPAPSSPDSLQYHLWIDFNDPTSLAKIPDACIHRIIVDWSTWRYMTPLKPIHETPAKPHAHTESRISTPPNKESIPQAPKCPRAVPRTLTPLSASTAMTIDRTRSPTLIGSLADPAEFAKRVGTMDILKQQQPHHSGVNVASLLQPNHSPKLQKRGSINDQQQQPPNSSAHSVLIMDEWRRILKPNGDLLFEATVSSIQYRLDESSRVKSGLDDSKQYYSEDACDFEWEFDNPSHVIVSKRWALEVLDEKEESANSRDSSSNSMLPPIHSNRHKTAAEEFSKLSMRAHDAAGKERRRNPLMEESWLKSEGHGSVPEMFGSGDAVTRNRKSNGVNRIALLRGDVSEKSSSQPDLGSHTTTTLTKRNILSAPNSFDAFREGLRRDVDRRVAKELNSVLDRVWKRVFVKDGKWTGGFQVVEGRVDGPNSDDLDDESYPVPTNGWIERWVRVVK